MFKQFAATAAFALIGLALPACASPITYDIAGSQQGGGTFSGSIQYDPRTGVVSGGTISAYTSPDATAPIDLLFQSATGRTSTFESQAVGPFYGGFTLVLGGTNGAPSISTDSYGAGYVIFTQISSDAVTSGTITPELNLIPGPPVTPAAVTPEPSSLALLGTGILGALGVARRRIVSA